MKIVIYPEQRPVKFSIDGVELSLTLFQASTLVGMIHGVFSQLENPQAFDVQEPDIVIECACGCGAKHVKKAAAFYLELVEPEGVVQ